MQVKFKKLHPEAVIPSYAQSGDAGLDLTAISRSFDEENSIWKYDTGLALEIPEGYVGLVFPRSSILKTTLALSNSVGIVDSGYRGSISFHFRETNKHNTLYNIGDRIGQLVIMPFPKIEIIEVSELSSSERGKGGFGSTGN